MDRESKDKFFRSNVKPSRSQLLFVEDIALDVYDINYIQFDDKDWDITVGFKNKSEHVFGFQTGPTYRRVKHTIMGYIDKIK